MTYKEWAEQYMNDAAVIGERIRTLRAQVPHASLSELKELDFRIKTLSDMYHDSIRVAKQLVNRRGELH